MSGKRQSCLLALLFGIAASGCAGNPTDVPPQSRHVDVARYFPKPAPLSGDGPPVIRLEIQVVSGALHFVSLDQPSYRDIRLTPTGVTAERDDIILEVDELHWHVGETVITLKGGRVTLDYKKPEGARSQLLFELSGKFVNVSLDGKWMKSGTSELVDLDAETGRVIFF